MQQGQLPLILPGDVAQQLLRPVGEAPLQQPARGLGHKAPGEEGQPAEEGHGVLEADPVRQQEGNQAVARLTQGKGNGDQVTEHSGKEENSPDNGEDGDIPGNSWELLPRADKLHAEGEGHEVGADAAGPGQNPGGGVHPGAGRREDLCQEGAQGSSRRTEQHCQENSRLPGQIGEGRVAPAPGVCHHPKNGSSKEISDEKEGLGDGWVEGSDDSDHYSRPRKARNSSSHTRLLAVTRELVIALMEWL